jgi:bifunctional non-homologous end joining protein LigD
LQLAASWRNHVKSALNKQAAAQAGSGALPPWIAPQLATAVSEAPPLAGWSFEIRYDGYRMLARICDGEVRLLTRHQEDWTERFAPIAAGLRSLNLADGWIDGEVVVFDRQGKSDFRALQRTLDPLAARLLQASPVFVAFDLLFLNGADLRSLPLRERRRLLEPLLVAAASPALRPAEQAQGNEASLLVDLCRLGLEGVIAKRLDASYESRRTHSWLKLNCPPHQGLMTGSGVGADSAWSNWDKFQSGGYRAREPWLGKNH